MEEIKFKNDENEERLDKAIDYLSDHLVSNETTSDYYREYQQLHFWLFELRELRREMSVIKSIRNLDNLLKKKMNEEGKMKNGK